MCLCSLLLLLPHTCLGWILRAYFVRVYLLYLIFFFTTARVAYLMEHSSGNRLPVITVAFVNGDISGSPTSATQPFMHFWGIQQFVLLRAGMMFWYNGSLWASHRDIWMEFNDIVCTRSHVSHGSWCPSDLKLFKIHEIRGCWTKVHPVHVTGSGSMLFPYLKSRQPPCEFSSLGISSQTLYSPAGYLGSTMGVWILQPKIKCFCYCGYWEHLRTTWLLWNHYIQATALSSRTFIAMVVSHSVLTAVRS